MPTLTLEYEDLCSLLGVKIPLKKLENLLGLIKCQVEKTENGNITVEVTADRPDLLSVEGVARTLRGFLGRQKGGPTYKIGKSKVKVKVSRKVKAVRPHIACAVVSGVKFTSASIAQLMQLQEKLHETLCRRRRKASIGVYDIDKVKPPIAYTALKPEEIAFTPLEEARQMSASEILSENPKGVEYRHLLEGLPRYPLLVDSRGQVLSMPPIVNSEETKVTLETRNLFIDVTGFNPEVLEEAVSIIASSLAERKARIEAVPVEYEGGKRLWTCTMKPRKMTVEASAINSLLGFNLPARRLAEILERMGFQTKVKGGKLEASIPAYRCDILHPVDLAEDVAIGFNYDLIKPEPLKVPTTGKLLSSTKVRRKIRDLMAGFGFQEVASYILSSREAQTVRMRLEGGVRLVELANPTSSEYTVIRCWVIPSLLEFLSRNIHVEYPQRVFELGDVVLPDLKAETATKVECRLAAAITDFKVSYEDVQAAAYSLLRQLGFKDWKVKPAEHPSFIPGRAALLEANGVETVLLGEIHPQILESLQLPNPVAAMEVNLTSLLPEAFQCEKV